MDLSEWHKKTPINLLKSIALDGLHRNTKYLVLLIQKINKKSSILSEIFPQKQSKDII